MRLAVEDRSNRAFDERHRVETAREEALGELGLSPNDAQRGNGVYRVTWDWLIEKALARLDIDFRRYTFIDYGSGKGKAMLIAARRPFKSIIGIEFARHLHEIAAANCQTYRNLDQKCHSLLPIFGDVLHYPLPPGPIICFMCNPFDHKTLRAVFNNWRERYQRGEQEIRILYLNMRDIAESAEVLAEQEWLIPIARDRRFVVLAPAVARNAKEAR
ncbi:hypothetical protein [Bradyrhizobium erythrophlei]|uniref:Class I SAM-dependent methyltransferase n=1 Tax=Bradyrhizobium erythrophlei TaxID=1437360 RepID=A0A1M7UXW6_9BRAD|nr:hypothetical protein [Bradyrhizobium erythrophlei]SHN87809.1 hypothetical protein SAMN05444170_7381 [Bradyrhizobium erythrophlei]